MKKLLLLALAGCGLNPVQAQYAPQAGISGSTAVPAASHLIYSWATGCQVKRGLADIGNPGGGYVSAGDSSMAIGPSDGTIVSLGDSGVAVLTFARPLYNGPGPDFAVFENGFINPVNGEEAFSELAFTEVSSDGVYFFRFPAASLTTDTVQVPGAGVYLNARRLNNLAGKYAGGYGTPFDLQELAGTPGLDIDRITHVRLVDVIGAVGAAASLDASGRKINDPFPTPWPGGGFDLDAVGVLQPVNTGVDAAFSGSPFRVFPNPAGERLFIRSDAPKQDLSLRMTDVAGRTVWQRALSGNSAEIDMRPFAHGMYYLLLTDHNGLTWVEKICRQ